MYYYRERDPLIHLASSVAPLVFRCRDSCTLLLSFSTLLGPFLFLDLYYAFWVGLCPTKNTSPEEFRSCRLSWPSRLNFGLHFMNVFSSALDSSSRPFLPSPPSCCVLVADGFSCRVSPPASPAPDRPAASSDLVPLSRPFLSLVSFSLCSLSLHRVPVIGGFARRSASSVLSELRRGEFSVSVG